MAEIEDGWRIECYQDETDPFAALSWFIMRGNSVIAQCEVEAHAERILLEHRLFEAYTGVLTQIARMASEGRDIHAASEAARRALAQLDG